jgi:hypothetical protein
MQTELEQFVKTCLPEYEIILIDSRKIIKPLELDIYIPSRNLAIEFNGTFWHSENNKTDKYYHINKTKLCEEKGIHLVHIFEWEWLYKKDKVQSRLRHLLNKKQNKIFARKCEIKVINKSISDDFLNINHLQGSCSGNSVNLGLYYKDELIALMTFGKPRFNTNYEWELLRFCTKYPVIGGASKLLNYFEQTYKPKSIISYANRCWTYKENNVYKTLGFKEIEESDPNYIYISKHTSTIYTRYQCQKHKLKDLLKDTFDSKLTEYQNMEKANYLRVYDCGNLVFIKQYI